MIAIDIPRKRIYIRGDVRDAYRWFKERFYGDWADVLAKCVVLHYSEEHRLMSYEDPYWTIEHNPEPL